MRGFATPLGLYSCVTTRPNRHSFEIMAVEDEIACGGVYLVNLQRRINVLAEDLRELTMNTMVCRLFAPPTTNLPPYRKGLQLQ